MKIIANIEVPQSWEEVTYQQWLQLGSIPEDNFTTDNPTVGVETNIRIVCILTRKSSGEIDALNYKDYVAILAEIQKFINSEIPRSNKVKWDFISIKDLKMDKWMAFEQYKSNLNANIPKILTLMQTKYSDADIKKMPITEVLGGFFMLKRKSNRYMRHFQLYSTKVIVKVSLKKWWMEKKSWIRKRILKPLRLVKN